MTSFKTQFSGTAVEVPEALVKKYDRPGPRYTSYPTAPEWHSGVGDVDFWAAIERGGGTPLSLYVHLPFCEEHCTFCGCSTVITKKHEVAETYLKHLIQEITLVAERVGRNRPVIQLHWGGGTPTYLSESQLAQLMEVLRARFQFAPDAEISVEVDPRVTTAGQLRMLRKQGVNRISMGVQDFNPIVQAAIARIQPESQTRQMIELCRELAFDSVNADLIYGLPHQSVASFEDTVSRLITMAPDRVALFNFAYVPWLKKQQQAIPPETLPSPKDKFQIFCNAISAFSNAGYLFIGMDHFAKPTDELSNAVAHKKLARNFQGYTTRAGDADMISFGITAISDIAGTYTQNKKILTQYYRDISEGHLAIERGITTSADDRLRRRMIMELLCNHHLDMQNWGVEFKTYFSTELTDLVSFASDGLVTLTNEAIDVTPVGRMFIRNIAMVFDRYLRNAGQNRRFSRTV